jgi:small subunit ribosomal protein S1
MILQFQTIITGGNKMSETMKDYENELEASFRTIEEGDILSGTVVSVDEKEVVLDLNFYAPGVIALEDYSREPGFSLKDSVHVGDVVKATVTKKDDHGNIRLSRVEANDVLSWEKLKELMDHKEPVNVVIKGIVKGGAVAYVEDVRGFIPASRLDINYVENTEDFLNKELQVLVVEVDKEKKRLILSARELLREKAREERRNRISSISVGYVTEATVESLQPYGAFVKMDDGLSGLVHISQISVKRIAKPQEVLSVGDRVKVKVIAIKDGKLSLSIREADETSAKAPEKEEQEKDTFVYEQPKEQATTSLGSLFANIKLN